MMPSTAEHRRLADTAADEPGYVGKHSGGPEQRDAAYHQGAAWPWLLGPFIEAWVRVRSSTFAAQHKARLRFLRPLLAHLETAGLGHVSELADPEEPYAATGCPFQAWSLAELLRVDRLLADDVSLSRAAVHDVMGRAVCPSESNVSRLGQWGPAHIAATLQKMPGTIDFVDDLTTPQRGPELAVALVAGMRCTA